MIYLLDSDIVNILYNKENVHNEKALHSLESMGEDDSFCISVLTLYELHFSLENMRRDSSKKEFVKNSISKIERMVPTVTITNDGARIYGRLKSRYANYSGANKKVLRRHNIDFMIASTAIDRGYTLVSNDKIYKVIQTWEPNLFVENWIE
jgi:predicted nucleic acid-binding protein